MEIKEKHVFELFLGLVFVGLLLVIVLLVIYLPEQKSITSNVIQNSYNSNSFNNYENQQDIEIVKIPKTHEIDFYETDNYRKYLHYSSWGEHMRDKVFGNYRDEFNVHVVNKDFKSGYFDVKFKFCDYYGICFTRTIQKYIPAKESRNFVYVDVQKERFEYYTWEYKVFPEVIERN